MTAHHHARHSTERETHTDRVVEACPCGARRVLDLQPDGTWRASEWAHPAAERAG